MHLQRGGIATGDNLLGKDQKDCLLPKARGNREETRKTKSQLPSSFLRGYNAKAVGGRGEDV